MSESVFDWEGGNNLLNEVISLDDYLNSKYQFITTYAAWIRVNQYRNFGRYLLTVPDRVLTNFIELTTFAIGNEGCRSEIDSYIKLFALGEGVTDNEWTKLNLDYSFDLLKISILAELKCRNRILNFKNREKISIVEDYEISNNYTAFEMSLLFKSLSLDDFDKVFQGEFSAGNKA